MSLQALVTQTLAREEVQMTCGEPNCTVPTKHRVSSVADSPMYLIVEVKRFQFDEVGVSKLNQRLCQISPLAFGTRSGYKYVLRAFACHEGPTANSGHYISYGLSDSGWRQYDDSVVMCVDASTAMSAASSAYVLMFVRVSQKNVTEELVGKRHCDLRCATTTPNISACKRARRLWACSSTPPNVFASPAAANVPWPQRLVPTPRPAPAKCLPISSTVRCFPACSVVDPQSPVTPLAEL